MTVTESDTVYSTICKPRRCMICVRAGQEGNRCPGGNDKFMYPLSSWNRQVYWTLLRFKGINFSCCTIDCIKICPWMLTLGLVCIKIYPYFYLEVEIRLFMNCTIDNVYVYLNVRGIKIKNLINAQILTCVWSQTCFTQMYLPFIMQILAYFSHIQSFWFKESKTEVPDMTPEPI